MYKKGYRNQELQHSYPNKDIILVRPDNVMTINQIDQFSV